MKKIMFNDKYGLTDAVLQGRKTMTRRIVQEKYLRIYEDMSRLGQPCHPLEEWLIRKAAAYKVGEVVAVAQSYKDAGIDPHFLMFQPIKGSNYFAEMEIEAMFTGGWNNKIFVRADQMPNKIRITDIKVERLQDISDEDCLKEGVYYDADVDGYKVFNLSLPNKGWGRLFRQMYFKTPREAFAALIERPGIGHKGDWSKNPWVFAYTFELVK